MLNHSDAPRLSGIEVKLCRVFAEGDFVRHEQYVAFIGNAHNLFVIALNRENRPGLNRPPVWSSLILRA